MVTLARKDLIPFSERTEDEQKKICSKGGQASGASRRRKRDARLVMEGVLRSRPRLDEKTRANLGTLGIRGDGKNHDQYDLELIASAALVQKAMQGNVQAYRLMMEILGEDAATQRERERMAHERRMMELENAAPDMPDDGFIEALNAVDVFDGPKDEPLDLGDGESDGADGG